MESKRIFPFIMGGSGSDFKEKLVQLEDQTLPIVGVSEKNGKKGPRRLFRYLWQPRRRCKVETNKAFPGETSTPDPGTQVLRHTSKPGQPARKALLDVPYLARNALDYQHHYFVELINWLSSKLGAGESAGSRQRYIEEIRRYASFHFFSEENQMLEIGYPDLEHHQELHRKLINNLNQIASRIEMGEIDSVELIHFLIRWLLDHTAEEDHKIAKVLATKP